MRQIAISARYSENMEWACPVSETNNNILIIGLSDFGQKAAGTLTFIELPKINDHFEKDAIFAVTESDKMANEICLPVAGTIIEVNESLVNDPTLINREPYDQGWIVKIKPDHSNDFLKLMSAQEFEKYIGAFFRKL